MQIRGEIDSFIPEIIIWDQTRFFQLFPVYNKVKYDRPGECSPEKDDRTLLYDMTPGFKPFTIFFQFVTNAAF